MSENSVLRRIFGHKKVEAIGGWRNLHYEELHNLNPSPNIISMTKSRRVMWATCSTNADDKCIHNFTRCWLARSDRA
jgi:hypothetical protein